MLAFSPRSMAPIYWSHWGGVSGCGYYFAICTNAKEHVRIFWYRTEEPFTRWHRTPRLVDMDDAQKLIKGISHELHTHGDCLAFLSQMRGWRLEQAHIDIEIRQQRIERDRAGQWLLQQPNYGRF